MTSSRSRIHRRSQTRKFGRVPTLKEAYLPLTSFGLWTFEVSMYDVFDDTANRFFASSSSRLLILAWIHISPTTPPELLSWWYLMLSTHIRYSYEFHATKILHDHFWRLKRLPRLHETPSSLEIFDVTFYLQRHNEQHLHPPSVYKQLRTRNSTAPSGGYRFKSLELSTNFYLEVDCILKASLSALIYFFQSRSQPKQYLDPSGCHN